MLLRWNPLTRKWEVPFAHHHADKGGDDGDAARGADQEPDAKTLAAENAKLKKDLAAIGPKLDKIEAEEKKRTEDAKRREEDKRKKEEGADKLLEEKTKALTDAQVRLEAFEKRERARVDAAFDELPEELQEPIAGMKDRLDLPMWAELVEKQKAAAEKLAGDKGGDEGGDDVSKATGVFLRPGSEKKQGYQVSAKAREILEGMGKDPDTMSSIVVKREVDKDTGQSLVKFTRQITSYFRDMNKAPTYRLMGGKDAEQQSVGQTRSAGGKK